MAVSWRSIIQGGVTITGEFSQMDDEAGRIVASRTNSEVKFILLESLVGTIGVMWVVGGGLGALKLFDVHWALGWFGVFIWIWGCWAAALFFDVQRFFR